MRLETVSAIALNTFRELIRSKILYTIFIFAIIIVITSSLFGSVTIGDKILVIKNFGLFCISIFSVAFAVISGSMLLQKELTKKTIFNILAKPVRRAEFVVGKYLGLFYTTTILVVMMGFALSTFIFILGGTGIKAILLACIYIIMEIAIVSAVAIFFSAITVTPVLIGIFTFGIFLAGRSAGYVLNFANSEALPAVTKIILKLLYTVLPHLNQIWVADLLVFNISPGFNHLISTFFYSFAYLLVVLSLSALLFENKEFS